MYLLDEIDYIEEKVAKLSEDVEKIRDRIREIESGELVKDKVYGGEGGWQGFVITGVPTKELAERKNALLKKKVLIEEHKRILEVRKAKSLAQVNEIEAFINAIDDVLVREIVQLRIIERKSWNEVADKVGGGNTEYSVKKIYYRYIDAYCHKCHEEM